MTFHPECRYLLVGLSLLLSYLNYRGLTVVGHAIVTSIIAILVRKQNMFGEQ